MWIHKSFFKYATAAILVLLIIFLLGKIDYLSSLLLDFITVIFFPVLIAGLFYYILRTPVRWLANYLPKPVSILIVFALVAGLFSAFSYYGGSMLKEQLSGLSDEFPNKVEEMTEESKKAIEDQKFGVNMTGMEDRIFSYLRSFTENLTKNIGRLVSTLTSIATVLIVVPFLLFYFLKDDDKLRPYIIKLIPEEHEDEGNKILEDIDKTLFTYVTGQFIIAIVDGTLMYIGYKIIGLEFALILAVFAMFMTIVPFFGPMIGILPALFIALMASPIQALKVLAVLVIVQQLEGNLITPFVMGKRLNLHPITVILLLLAAGSLYGFIGILIAIPLYSVLKIIVKDIRKFYRLRRKKKFIEAN